MSEPKSLSELKVGEVYIEEMLRKLGGFNSAYQYASDAETVVFFDYGTYGAFEKTECIITAIYDRREEVKPGSGIGSAERYHGMPEREFGGREG